jgi:hypothetical protein
VVIAVRNSYLQLVIEMITNLRDHPGKIARESPPRRLADNGPPSCRSTPRLRAIRRSAFRFGLHYVS